MSSPSDMKRDWRPVWAGLAIIVVGILIIKIWG
jgi:hypothetical protein